MMSGFFLTRCSINRNARALESVSGVEGVATSPAHGVKVTTITLPLPTTAPIADLTLHALHKLVDIMDV